jgi:hypothetical protein
MSLNVGKAFLASVVLCCGFMLSGCNGLSAGGFVELGSKNRAMGDTCLCRGENCACAPGE